MLRASTTTTWHDRDRERVPQRRTSCTETTHLRTHRELGNSGIGRSIVHRGIGNSDCPARGGPHIDLGHARVKSSKSHMVLVNHWVSFSSSFFRKISKKSRDPGAAWILLWDVFLWISGSPQGAPRSARRVEKKRNSGSGGFFAFRSVALTDEAFGTQ